MKRDQALNIKPIIGIGALGGILFLLGFLAQEAGGSIITLPFVEFKIISAKLGGVLAMFGSLLALALMPWLDWHPVRSANSAPYTKSPIGVCCKLPNFGCYGR